MCVKRMRLRSRLNIYTNMHAQIHTAKHEPDWAECARDRVNEPAVFECVTHNAVTPDYLKVDRSYVAAATRASHPNSTDQIPIPTLKLHTNTQDTPIHLTYLHSFTQIRRPPRRRA